MKEGEWLDFLVGNKLEIPENETNIILIGKDGMKYLIPEKPYLNYGIKTGDSIRCKIDKINCTGRIFLEPQHPYYQEGESYTFKFIRKEKNIDPFNKPIFSWILHDISENEIILKVEAEYFEIIPSDTLECQILRIKKGKIFLKHRYSVHPPDPGLLNTWLDLMVEHQSLKKDKDDFFLLSDTKGEKYSLKKKYFQVYGIKPGDTIACKLAKWDTEGNWIIEPKHPYYEEEKEYPFIVLEINSLPHDEQEINFIVKDCFANKILVTTDVNNAGKLVVNQEITLKVKALRKAQPVLSL